MLCISVSDDNEWKENHSRRRGAPALSGGAENSELFMLREWHLLLSLSVLSALNIFFQPSGLIQGLVFVLHAQKLQFFS